MKTDFSDDQVLLRRFRPNDAVSLYEAGRESVNEIVPWMSWCERDFALGDSEAWIEYVRDAWDQQQAFNFAVVEKANQKLVGSTWLSHIILRHGFANVGYWVRTSCAGRGMATRAVRLLSEFGFSELQLRRLEIMVAVGNRASERVAEKVGAQREGILRQRLQLDGQAKDAVMFGLLAHKYAH